MTVRLSLLRTFAQVALSGNLREAAASLGRTPSAVSMALRQLEDHLERPLFDGDRKQTLTPLGRFVYEQARTELDRYDRMVEAIETFAKSDLQTLRIAAVPSVAATLLPAALLSFRKKHPDVPIDLQDMSSAGVMDALLRDEVDIGLATATTTFRFPYREVLLDDAFGVVCAKDHVLAQGTGPVEWAELASHNFLANNLIREQSSPELSNLLECATINVPNTTSLLAMVKGGLGVTILPELVAGMDSEGLRFRKLADQTLRRPIEMFHGASPKGSPLIYDLTQCVRAVSERILL